MKPSSGNRSQCKPPFRYISESKVSMLEDKGTSITEASASVLGAGVGFKVDRSQSITSRLNAVVKNLRKEELISDISESGKNYIEGTCRFIETAMMGVAIWVGIEGNTTILLGGSTVHLQFSKINITEHVPGSNRSGILRALTTLWRVGIDKNNQMMLDTTNPINLFDITMAELWGGEGYCKVTDDIRYDKKTINMPHNIKNYYRCSNFVYNLFENAFVDNLNFIAINFTDYTFPDDTSDSEYRGKRFLIGSPIYVSQIAPARQ